jgi:hypothetical protein
MCTGCKKRTMLAVDLLGAVQQLLYCPPMEPDLEIVLAHG